MMNSTKAKTVGEYISWQPAAVAKRLRAIRALVKKTAPDATEGISYMMPGYKLNGPLLYFGAFKNHIGFYPTSLGVAAIKKELKKYQVSKGAIQFQHDEPLPLPLIRKIVMQRVRENRKKR